MNDTLLHEPSNQMKRKKKASHNDPHTAAKRILLNAAKFADYCSMTLRHAVETPFQAYADEYQMTPKQYHLSSQTGTSSILPHCSNLNDKLLPASDNCQPFIDPHLPSLAYRGDRCSLKKDLLDIEDNGPTRRSINSTKVISSSITVRCSSPFHVVDAANVSDTEGYIRAKCIDTPSSLVADTVDTVPPPSCHKHFCRHLTNDSPGANKPEAAQPCFNPSKLPNENSAVIELKPLFPCLHPPETVTTCSDSILTSPTYFAGHFYRGSVKDITLQHPSDSSSNALDAKITVTQILVPPLHPDLDVVAISEPKSKSVSKLKAVVPIGPDHASQLYSSMPNDYERFPRPICTNDTLSGRYMEYENTPISLNRLMSVDNEKREHGSLEHFDTKTVSVSPKQPKSIKYRRQAYSEKLKLRCSK